MNQPEEFIHQAESAWGVTFTEIEGEIFNYQATDDAGSCMSIERKDSGVILVLHSAELVRLQQATPPSGDL